MSYGPPGTPYWRPHPNPDPFRQPYPHYATPQPCVPGYYRLPVAATVDPTTHLTELWREVDRLRRLMEGEVERRQQQLHEYQKRVERLEQEVAELRARQANNTNASPAEANADPLWATVPQASVREPETSLRDFLAGFYDASGQTARPEREEVAVDEACAMLDRATFNERLDSDLYLFGGMCPGNKANRFVEKFDGDGGGYWLQVGELPPDLDKLHLAAVEYDQSNAFLFSAFPLHEKKQTVFKCTFSEEATWTPVSPPMVSRCLGAHARMGDCICVAGGYTSNRPILWSSFVFPFPPDLTRMDALATVEIFDPAHDSWTYLPSLLQPRIRSVLVSTSPHVLYAMGGLTFGDSGRLRPTNTIERCDSRQGRWLSIAHMDHCRAFFDVVQVQQHSLVALGGISSSVSASPMLETAATDSMECYEARMNKWTAMPSMPTNRCMFTAHLFQEHLYLIGGQPQLSRGQRPIHGTGMIVYDCQEQNWREQEMLAGMSSKRYAHASCVL